jgi:hypothetical protein
MHFLFRKKVLESVMESVAGILMDFLANIFHDNLWNFQKILLNKNNKKLKYQQEKIMIFNN